MMINNGATGMHQANYSYMEDGGLIPLMEEGGELQTHWGGHAETVSQNPYLEDGGELANLFSKGGMESLAGSGIVDKGLSTLIPGIDDNGGATIGGAIGGTAGTLIGGPVGGMVGKTLGKVTGSLLDTTGKKTQKYNRGTQNNLSSMMINNGATAMHQANYSYMEDGGLIPLMEEGGELQTHWGGRAETVSQNPYLEDGGETIMFRGNSHDESDNNGNTGIGITYGNSPVEVERGEPATKIDDEYRDWET